jgi:hypothetical protein
VYETSGLKGAARDAALTDDGLKRADSDFRVIRNWHRDCFSAGSTLHDDVTAALPDDLETVLFEDATDFSAGENSKPTHAPLQSG